MNQIVEKSKCCGCGACFCACSQNAVTLRVDEEGFEYPFIDQNICVDCGLCKKVCPVVQYEKRQDVRVANSSVQLGFAARNRNYEQRLASSSGSIFPLIAGWVLDRGGVVVGAAFDENFNVIHKIIDDKRDLDQLQGSKYLQVKMDKDTFRRIQKELLTGRIVLYSGMACQVEGLKTFLRKEYENLYTIDLICMGIPSYVVWQKYLKAFFTDERIKSVNFKEKSVGWDSFVFKVETEKRVFQEYGMENLYLQSMFRTWNMRYSCFQCPFKKDVRVSDFTLADAWGVSKNTPQINDNKGLSSVVVHSSKGFKLWNEIGECLDKVSVSIDEIAKGNPNLVSNKPQMGNRKLFYKMLENNPKKAFQKLCAVKRKSWMRMLLAQIKRGLCR